MSAPPGYIEITPEYVADIMRSWRAAERMVTWLSVLCAVLAIALASMAARAGCQP